MNTWIVCVRVMEGAARSYAAETLNLLFQLEYVLTPRLKEQLLWDRTVNRHGRPWIYIYRTLIESAKNLWAILDEHFAIRNC